jgi:hypothetical protein
MVPIADMEVEMNKSGPLPGIDPQSSKHYPVFFFLGFNSPIGPRPPLMRFFNLTLTDNW